ncbi:glycoside hydrolase family 16 protein [Peniophora sp. CONT]|nr:glycoside hydrolase family 16 protein [Peniophora sp. CONT]
MLYWWLALYHIIGATMRMFVGSLLPLALFLGVGASTVFLKQDEYIGDDFFATWQWETFDDPTHGRTNYVDQSAARQKNLSVATSQKFVMRADDTTVVSDSARGRDSIRISSKASYDEALFVIDVAHMPSGCATWPAWWTVSAAGPWPAGGEIDIIEGVNRGTQNLASLHTTSGCSVPHDRAQTGTTISTDCDAALNSNQGCGTLFTAPDSAEYQPFAAQGENATEAAPLSTTSQSYPALSTATTESTSGSQTYATPEAELPASSVSNNSASYMADAAANSSPSAFDWTDPASFAQGAIAAPQEPPSAPSSAPTAVGAASFFSVGAGGELDRRLGARADTTTSSAPSFGAPFNAAGGGYYAMSKSRAGGINVWFWSRDSASVPVEVKYGGDVAVPSVSWGTPAATFPLNDNCPYNSHFDAHRMVFDLTLCGDWAGAAWGASGCGTGTCEDYVNNNPQAFSEAYWEINSVRVFVPATKGW